MGSQLSITPALSSSAGSADVFGKSPICADIQMWHQGGHDVPPLCAQSGHTFRRELPEALAGAYEVSGDVGNILG